MDIVKFEFDKMFEILQQREEERKTIISSQIKKGCNKCSQWNEYYGCDKCEKIGGIYGALGSESNI